MNHLKPIQTGLIAFFCYSGASGQSIQNVKASPLQDGKVTVTYDITGAKANQKFVIELFSSHNSFSSPLTEVTGDVGKNVTGGSERKITWNVSDELVDYKGEISCKVRGSAVALPFVMMSPSEGGSVRRGKKTDLKWEGGAASQTIKLELYKGADRVSAIAETKNSGEFTWSVPKNLGKGSYTVKLSAGQQNVSSKAFLVKSKIPLLLKALPILAIGGLVAVLGGGSGGGKPPTTGDLPAAPGPGTN